MLLNQINGQLFSAIAAPFNKTFKQARRNLYISNFSKCKGQVNSALCFLRMKLKFWGHKVNSIYEKFT